MQKSDVTEFAGMIKSLSRKYGNNRSDRMDLSQTLWMELIGLLAKPRKENGYYYRALYNKAMDFLTGIEHNYTYRDKFPHYSIDAMIDSEIQIDTEGNLYTKGKEYVSWYDH